MSLVVKSHYIRTSIIFLNFVYCKQIFRKPSSNRQQYEIDDCLGDINS